MTYQGFFLKNKQTLKTNKEIKYLLSPEDSNIK